MFGLVCTIGPSFFNTTSDMHLRPFEGRHLVPYLLPLAVFFQFSPSAHLISNYIPVC